MHPSADPASIEEMRKTIYQMKDQLDAMLRALGSHTAASFPASAPVVESAPLFAQSEQVIEGVFDGEGMVGQDGNTYPIPPNYASKSKLVEGDLMKLTITVSGKLVYKQIAPTQRKHVRGELVFDAASQKWSALANGRMYRILTASITFHKGRSGDTVMLIVPDSGESQWAAVETILPR